MEKKVDIIPFLESVVEENTISYQLDIAHDELRLQKAMLEVKQEDRTFLWMSRPCGTWCFLEREVFLHETPAHLTWAYKEYAAGAEHIKSFRIIVAPGRPGAFVLGKVQPLNYAEQMQRVKQNALHVQTVKMTFEDKTVFTVPFTEYPSQYRSLSVTHGKVESIYYAPENEAELSCVLRAERAISAAKKRARRPRKPQTR